MTESLVKQIINLKEEHSLMLEALDMVLKYFYHQREISYKDVVFVVTAAKVAAELGNERRLVKGNVEL